MANSRVLGKGPCSLPLRLPCCLLLELGRADELLQEDVLWRNGQACLLIPFQSWNQCQSDTSKDVSRENGALGLPDGEAAVLVCSHSIHQVARKEPVNYSNVRCAQSLSRLRPPGLQLTRLLCLWDFSGKETGVGCRFILQGIFPTQGSNLCLLHRQADSLPLSPLGSP